jgi:hypothetical protein
MVDNPFTGTLSVTGNVGIGAEPLAKAQLYIKSTTAETSQVYLEGLDGKLLKLSVDTQGAKLSRDTSFPLSILAGNSSQIEIDAVGNVGIGTPPTLTEKLTVNGNLKATSFLGNGETLDGIVKKAGDTMTGPLTIQNILTVSGGAITPAAGNSENAGIMFPKDPAGGSGDAAWIRYYPRTGEATTLEIGTSNNSDDHIALMASGNVGIGTNNPQAKLEVNGAIRAGNSDIYFTKTDHNSTGIGNTAGFAAIENAANYDALMILGRAGTSKGRSVKLWDYLQVNGNLEVTGNITVGSGLNINGDFELPNTGGNFARFTNQKFNNESSFKNNNVKLSLGSSGMWVIPNAPPLEYEFAIGHTFTGFVRVGGVVTIYTNFAKKFSINQTGDLYCAGSKAGFVADYFVNRVGDTLEQGDVVVISKYQVSHYSGTQNNIPILEVDLTDRACDTRVCGIVAKFVTEQDLPFAEVEPDSEIPPPELIEQLMSEATENPESYTHPLKPFASEFKEDADATKVQDQQMGLMVTLGAFAHCKVDADIAPIAVGDLLTTSPTRGHAQKVLEPEKAVGAIVGKALASLEKGKGKIPVLVMLQ